MSVPQPSYILRGHASPIHSTLFFNHNRHLITGDAEGWTVGWDLSIKRPIAVWKAHEGAILGFGEWKGSLITHGKDNKLIVWQFDPSIPPSTSNLSTLLPVEDALTPRKQPWILYLLHVNTLNFCSFGSCGTSTEPDACLESESGGEKGEGGLLVAVPNALSSEAVDLFHLPSQHRICTVSPSFNLSPSSTTASPSTTGMVMAVTPLYLNTHLALLIGYESGHTAVLQYLPAHGWTTLYLANVHDQPVLGLDVDPDLERRFYLTSSADAVIGKHPLRDLAPMREMEGEETRADEETTKADEEDREDDEKQEESSKKGEIEEADEEIPRPDLPNNSVSNPSQPLSFAKTAIKVPAIGNNTVPNLGPSLLSEKLSPGTLSTSTSKTKSKAPPSSNSPNPANPPASTKPLQIQTHPLKTLRTHHAGQQSLSIRSDGKIFGTAGWDGRIRVYSAKTLKELAVLKWHGEGCFSCSFAEILPKSESDVRTAGDGGRKRVKGANGGAGDGVLGREDWGVVVGTSMGKEVESGLGLANRRLNASVREARELKTMSTHWLAAGSKDGKVSLWEIY